MLFKATLLRSLGADKSIKYEFHLCELYYNHMKCFSSVNSHILSNIFFILNVLRVRFALININEKITGCNVEIKKKKSEP